MQYVNNFRKYFSGTRTNGIFAYLLGILFVFLGTLNVNCTEHKEIPVSKIQEALQKRGETGDWVLWNERKTLASTVQHSRRLYSVGSLRKLLLLAWYLEALESGFLEKDTKVSDKLPILKASGKNILMSQLLEGTSGFQKQSSPRFKPGTFYSPTPEEELLLVEVLEKVTKKSLQAFLTEYFRDSLKIPIPRGTNYFQLRLTKKSILKLVQYFEEKAKEDSQWRKALYERIGVDDGTVVDKVPHSTVFFADPSFAYGYSDVVLYYRSFDSKTSLLYFSKTPKTIGQLVSNKSLIGETIYGNQLVSFEKAKTSKEISLEEARRRFQVPGISIAIVENFRISKLVTAGVLEKGSESVVKPNSLFALGSLSKPIFAFLIHALEKNNLWNQNVLLKGNLTHRPTTRQVLSHRGGLTERQENGKVYSYYMPGSRFRYSGGGYSELSHQVSSKLRKSLWKLEKQYVFTPLQMDFVSFSPLKGKSSAGHDQSGSAVSFRKKVGEEASSGVWASAKALAVFGIEIQKSLQGQGYLPRDLAERMLQPLELASPLSLQSKVATGFFLNSSSVGEYFYHGGHTGGHKSFLLFHKSKGYGVVILTNSENGSPLIWWIIRSLVLQRNWDPIVN